MSNPLEPVWHWYEMTRDALRIALRVVEKKVPKVITKNHTLHAVPASEAASRIKVARQELDNMAVVALVAVFERTLRVYLAQTLLPGLPAKDSFDAAIRDRIKNDIEFWNLSSQLVGDVFKTRVAPDLCGMVKQVIDYRHDVAHGHAAGKPTPGYADPAFVFQRLTRFLEDAQVVNS
jgi:hypothetical protein